MVTDRHSELLQEVSDGGRPGLERRQRPAGLPQPRPLVRQHLHVDELEGADPTVQRAPPQAARVHADDVNDVATTEAQCLAVIRARHVVDPGARPADCRSSVADVRVLRGRGHVGEERAAVAADRHRLAA